MVGASESEVNNGFTMSSVSDGFKGRKTSIVMDG